MKWRIKPDQSARIGCDEEGVVSEWTGDQYDRPRELFQLGPGFYRGSLSLDASKLAVGYQDGKVELWDIERQERIRSLDLGGGALLPDQFYANDQIVEVMSEGYWGSKFLWDIRRNRKMFDWSHTDNLISLDGTVGVSFYDGQIEMTDFSGAAPATLPEHWSKSFPFGRVAISPNGRLLGTVDPSRTVQIFDLQQRKRVMQMGTGFLVGPSSVYFSPDNRRIIAGGVSPYSIIMFDTESHQRVITLESVGDTRRWARFSPDGNIVYAQDEADIVYGWRAPSWEEIRRYEETHGVQ